MCPATPPTMAPLMHPFASAGETEAIASTQAEARIHFMIVLQLAILKLSRFQKAGSFLPNRILNRFRRRHASRTTAAGLLALSNRYELKRSFRGEEDPHCAADVQGNAGETLQKWLPRWL